MSTGIPAGGFVIVGASYAGVQMAAAARENGYDGPIHLIGEEPLPPYQRPPLSKGYLAGKVAAEALPLRGDAFYTENAITLVLGVRVTDIDRLQKTVHTGTGETLAYNWLGLATGARPRPLTVPGADLPGVHVVRTRADADALRTDLDRIGRIVVVGAGFIGLEVAATAALTGHDVTVVEAAPRLLTRALSDRTAAFLAERHEEHGVRFRFGTTVRRIEATDGRVSGVLLSNGDTVPADAVVVGIGVVPNTELAERCGLRCDNGIVVDRYAQASAPFIVAAGDCASHGEWPGEPLRLESVQNANDQGRAAGATVAGQKRPYDSVPWFWSDQYDIKLQMAGLSEGHDQVVKRASEDPNRFSLYYFREGSLIAVDSINRPADHMLARRLLAARAPVTPDAAGDAATDLRAFLTSAPV